MEIMKTVFCFLTFNLLKQTDELFDKILLQYQKVSGVF